MPVMPPTGKKRRSIALSSSRAVMKLEISVQQNDVTDDQSMILFDLWR